MHIRVPQIFDHLHLTINNYFIKVFERVQISLDPRNFDNPSLSTDLIISHLLFKILVTLAAWIWQQFSRMTEEEKQMSGSWVGVSFVNDYRGISSYFSDNSWHRCSIILFNNSKPLLSDAQKSLSCKSHYPTLRHSPRTKSSRNIFADSGNSIFDWLRSIINDWQSYRTVVIWWCFIGPKSSRQRRIFQRLKVCILPLTHSVPSAYNSSFTDQPAALFPVRFLVQGLVLFKDLLGQWKAQRRDGTPNKNG